ncbi:hypothetical protein CDL12_17613 [Olea europaea subsp. europaea]|uniref:Uncharacterized protein n=1 Tax=Olea europaea subsp. europaea TaxID=158383 RepID=A0A8S0RD43_OLEEU|nr:hypothetical protein CDL12_17613 [Olea europaea subsp. europaea]
MDENGMKARSFRYEDYNTRRVFLRSYPLHWGSESEAEESKEEGQEYREAAVNVKTGKKPVKKIILAAIQWGGERVILLRTVKDKIAIYLVNCIPVNFKVPTALISI